jgi:hypothetical protein
MEAAGWILYNKKNEKWVKPPGRFLAERQNKIVF